MLQGRPSGTRRCQAGSMEVPGAQGKPRAPDRWPESSGRGLDDDFRVETFFCQVWTFSVCQGRLPEAPGGVEHCPRRSQAVGGGQELQNGGLRALEEAWMTTFIQVEALPDASKTRPSGALRHLFGHPSGNFFSQATALELWAPSELQGPPGTRLDSSLGHLDASEAQKSPRLDRNLMNPEPGHPENLLTPLSRPSV